jgi:hypothetical protein
MKNEIGKNVLKFLFFLGCVYGIIRVSIWSYFQTQAFFIPFDEGSSSHIISHALSLLSQYGQNVVLFLASIEVGRQLAYTNKISKTQNTIHVSILEEEIRKSKTASFIYYSLFGVFAIIDSGTNLGQFFTTTLVEARKTVPPGFALVCFIIIGSLISVVVVFVEELFMNAANALLHALNDILESAGKKRLPGLDLFIDPDKVIATRLDAMNGKAGGGSMGNPQSSQQRPQNQMPQSLPRREEDFHQQKPNQENRPEMNTNRSSRNMPPPIRENPLSLKESPTRHTMRIPNDLLPSEDS